MIEVSVGGTPIVVAPEDAPPFGVDATVIEEDTYLVLSADIEVREPREHPLRILTEALETEPLEPGTVVVRSGPPLQLLAVVHDLGRDPTWREEWVATALAAALRESEARSVESLALPLLGTRHGKLRAHRFTTLLRAALAEAVGAHPRRIWLVTAAERRGEILALLR